MSKFKLFPLLNKYRVVTNGNAFGTAPSYSNVVFIDLDVPGLSEIIPQAEELTLFTLGESMSTEFRWNIFLRSAYDRSFEKDPILLGTTVAGPGADGKRQTAYSTVASFQLESRLQLGYGNNSGTALESGVVSAVLGVKYLEG